MTWEHTRTQKEEVCLDLVEEVRDTWSVAACTVLTKPESAARDACMYNYFPKESERGHKHYDLVIDEMRLAASELPGRDRELLEKLTRVALVVAASKKVTVVPTASPSPLLSALSPRHLAVFRARACKLEKR